MENGQLINLFITHIDQEGPFLKVWGQAEKTSSVYVEQFLSGASRQFDQGIGTLPPENLQVGSLVGAKYKDGKYYRARILSIDVLNECFIEVSFIDFGHKDIVPAPNLRSLQSFPPTFLSIPPLATSFIFAEVHSPRGGEWNDKVFETIHKELCFREVQCTLVAQATHFYLIKLFIGSSDLGNLFVGRGLMQPISIQAQQAVLLNLNMQKRLTPLPTTSVPNEINTYKACMLEPGCQYPVYVSYVNEGPSHFSVQLRQSEDALVKLMKDINAITLKLLEDVPLPGTICLARCQEDKSICRAVVTNEVDNQFKVFYVDFGNYEVVPLEALYQIPFKFVIPKVMAIRFGLVGIEKSSVTLEMKCAFKKFVDNRLLHMKVLPSPTRMSVSKCELWDPETKVSALEVVQRAALNAYPEPLSLNRGFSQPVKVSYVFSCNRFYVQLVSKELELTNLMAELQASCQNADVMDPADLKAELPCCALFEGDQQWYRSEIVEIVDENNVKVRYIDFGNEEIVPIGLLKMVEGELLTVLRPQAIECCLNGYQNMDLDAERDAILEELILEQQFTMKVVEMMDKKALVELTDDANYNIASLLLDKIAATKALVSPIIPVAKQPDQQWRSQQNGIEKEGFRSERRPPRENNKNWNENRSNEKSWRQENGDFRQDRDSNENTSDNNWRQNNKGYNRGNDRRDINDRLRRDTNKNTDSWGGNKDFNSIQESTENTAAADNWGSTDNSNQTPVNGPQGDAGWDDVTPQNDSGFKDRGYKKRDDGFRDGGFRKNDDGFRDGGFKKPRDDRFGDRNKRFDNDKDNRYARDGRGDGGFKKKSDFRRDDMSSSGSEKSFKKGPRTSSRNDHQRNDRFGGGGRNYRSDNKFQNSFGSPTNAEDSWNVSALSLPPMNAAASTDEFLTLDVVGSEAAVTISWFHNPVKFYCQLTSSQTEFKQMMEDIQEFYKGRKPESAVKGSPVVGLFPEDKVLYRGRVLDVFGSQYKVFYVDFGNISTIDKLWPIEKKFMELPAQALLCGLSGIGPPGETWPAANNYGKYFQKDGFMARFLYKDEERTHVNLFDGDQELSQLLVNDGTAVPLVQEPATSDIEIPLLLGQQFRALVKSINNLSDIIVALECGLALSCKAHNLELASETYEDNFKAYLEQTVILYVDNILENNVLDATFYDNEGNKINTLVPDEGAFENVEPLCPLLVLSSTIWAYVSHVEENSAFIQPSQFAEPIAVLLEQLFEFYEKQTEESPLIPEEGLLYAARSPDSNWYRARVISFDDEKATVIYVDYGNSESLPFSELRELNEQFYVPHVMCIQINTQTPMESFIEKDVVATIYYGESGWEGTVQEAPEVEIAPALSQVPRSSESVNTVLEVAAEPKPASVPPEIESIPEQTTEPTPISENSTIPAGSFPSTDTLAADTKGTPVFVSHIDSPNEFYLQRAEASTDLEDVQAYLQEVAESLEPLESVTVGALCAAPYSVDHQWYRAEVLDADDDITTVRFVDYGNTDVINNKTTRVKTLPPHLLSLAVHATRCSLKAKPIEPDEEWTQTAMECFEELANQEEVSADFVGQDEKKNYVELYVHGKSVTEVLVVQNLAKPWEMAAETKSTGFVSHLNSPSEFWIQLESCVDQLEWIAEQLSGAESFPELEDLSPGTLCAALFADDEMWYRARILSNTVAGIELLFIDYGNSCISSSLRQLPEDLVVTAPLALKCTLQKPAGIPQWNPQACEKFKEISADGQTIFTVKKISTGETSVVDLLLNDASVVESLLPQTVDGHVKNFESLDKFNVETNGEVSDSSYKIEPLPGMKWDGESCIRFKEINNEGSSLFQIEFLTNDTVCIYRDGSDIRINLGGTKLTETRKTEQVDTENVPPEINVSEEIVVEYDESQTAYVPSPKKHSSPKKIDENVVFTTDDSQFCDIESNEIQEQGTNTVEPFRASNFEIKLAKNADETQTENESLEESAISLKEQTTQYSAAELLNAETMTVDPDLRTDIENVIETEMPSDNLQAEADPETKDIGPDSVETSLEKDISKNLETEQGHEPEEEIVAENLQAEVNPEPKDTGLDSVETSLEKDSLELDQGHGPEEEIEAISDNLQLDAKEAEPIVTDLTNEEATSNEIKVEEKSPSKDETSDKLEKADDIPLKSTYNRISGGDEDSKPDDSKTITETSEDQKVIKEVKPNPEDTADKEVVREIDPSDSKHKESVGDKPIEEVETAPKIETSEEKSKGDDVEKPKLVSPETVLAGEDIKEPKKTEVVIAHEDVTNSKLVETVVTDDVAKPIPAETVVIDEHVEKPKPQLAETVVIDEHVEKPKPQLAETIVIDEHVEKRKPQLAETVVIDEHVEKPKPQLAETVVIDEQVKNPKPQLAETAEIDEDGALKSDQSELSSGSNSRSLSACSGKISHDDRIVPGVPKPQLAETVVMDEHVEKLKSQLAETAVIDEDEVLKGDKKEASEPSSGSNSRPLSACSGKISHDDRIVPAVLSRPQTPLTSDEEGEEKASKT